MADPPYPLPDSTGHDIVTAAHQEAHRLREAIQENTGTPHMLRLARALRLAEDGHPSSSRHIDALYKAADQENGHMPAMCFLGYFFETGVGAVVQDHKRARWLFEKDIECNDCDIARFVLAGKYTDDSPGEKDATVAVRLYEAALQKSGYHIVARHLAAIFDRGEPGVPSNPTRAVALYERAVRDGGSVESMYALARIYTEGREGVPRDAARAVELYERAIRDANVSKAMNSLALLLQTGAEGVTMDIARAVELFERAIGLGNCNAMNNLAFLISEGHEGVERDMGRVVELYERAIDGENLVSVRNLARILKLGDDGVPMDRPRALKLFEMLKEDAEMFRSVQFEIALLVSSGSEGIPLDYVRAAKIYERIISEESNVSAMFNLACLLSDGRGELQQDNVRAVALYERAILEGDDVLSMLNLGIMLGGDNPGLCGNKVRAVELLERAAAEGRKEANYHLGVVMAGFDGEAVDVQRSIFLFERCIKDMDHIGAMIDLSVVIGEGLHGVTPDIERALQLSERAIALGLEYDLEQLANLGIEVGEDMALRDDVDSVRERNHAISRGSHLISMLNLAELLISGKVGWDVDRALRLCERALTDTRAEKVCRFIQMDDLLRYTRKMSEGGGRNAEIGGRICELIIEATRKVNVKSCGHAIRVYARMLTNEHGDAGRVVKLYRKGVQLGDSKCGLLLGDLLRGEPGGDEYVFGMLGKFVGEECCDDGFRRDAVVVMADIYLHARVRQGKRMMESSTSMGLRKRIFRHVGLILPIVRYVWHRSC